MDYMVFYKHSIRTFLLVNLNGTDGRIQDLSIQKKYCKNINPKVLNI